MATNPYDRFVTGMSLVDSLAEIAERVGRITGGWSPEAFEKSHAPGKWTGRQILAHLAHAEMVFSTRLRFALAEEGYVIQPFDQDAWMTAESEMEGPVALETYATLRRANLSLCRSLTAARLQRPCVHPQFGQVDVAWIVAFFAGHERSHLPQLEAIQAQVEGTRS